MKKMLTSITQCFVRQLVCVADHPQLLEHQIVPQYLGAQFKISLLFVLFNVGQERISGYLKLFNVIGKSRPEFFQFSKVGGAAEFQISSVSFLSSRIMEVLLFFFF